MKFLTRFSMRNPVVIFILTALVIVGGVLSSLSLKEELMPNISFPVIGILTTYTGASPSVVASDVTDPLEKAVESLSGVQDVESNSVQNVSEIEVQLSLSADLNKVQQTVQQAVSAVQLPSAASTPQVQQFSFNSQPILYYTVSSNRLPFATLKNLVQTSIVPSLQGVSGVGSVTTTGAAPDQVVIQFHENELQKHQLTAQTVLQDLQADNITTPLGSATIEGKVQPVQLENPFLSIGDIRSLPIPIPPSATAGLKVIGSSIGELGKSVGQLAQGEGQLAAGQGQLAKGIGQVGQAVGQVGQGLGMVQAENTLLTNITAIQGQIMGAQMALAQQYAKPATTRDNQLILRYSMQIQGLEQTEQKLFAQLKKIAAAVPTPSAGHASAASATTGSGQPVYPTAGSQSANGNSASDSGVTAPATGSGGAATPSTTPTIPLSDLATVSLQPPTDAAINRTNGQRSVLIGIVKTDDANTVTTAQGVKTQMAALQTTLPHGVQITQLYDSSQSVVQSIDGMLREAILGAIFAAIVILLFLRNWLTTIIAVISIPVSLLIALIFLNQFNVTLNIMTLGGMAVATGRVVDDSIVVIENIYRSWKRASGYGRAFVLYATGEVGRAITSSTITTIAVFVPLGLVSGIVGKVFQPFALTVVFSLISSLLVALTVVPLLAWLLIARKAPKGLEHIAGEYLTDASDPALAAAFAADDEASTGTALRPWQHGYRKALSWTLNHKGAVIAITVIVFLGSLAVLPLAGSTFLPTEGDNYATVSIKMPVGTPESVTNAKAQQVEKKVAAFSTSVVDDNVQVGSDPGQYSTSGPSGQNQASFFVKLTTKANVNQFVDQLRSAVVPITGNAVIQVNAVSLASGGSGFDLVINGPNLPAITQAATQITNRLQHFQGLANVQNNLSDTQPQVSVQPKMQELAQYSLSPYQIAGVVRDYLGGQNIGNVELAGTQYPIVVNVNNQASLSSLAAMDALPITTPTGQTITLGEVADVTIAQTPVDVMHRDGQDYAEVTGDYTTQNTGSTTKLALQAVSHLTLPNGVTTQLSGGGQQLNQSFAELIEAVVVAVGMVYIVMLIAFGEWTAPFAILFSMPVALIGAFFGTWIGHQPISVSSLIGILMLMGIVVTNAIVLIARVEQQRERGMGIREALLEAGTTRLRPILMTAIATICALLPLALGLSEGALISQGLAVVVIGGLTTSTILTLVIVPLMYELLHFRRSRRERAVATV
ncbi:MAG: efflux RND transporter permease subunit [Firmicutes bacterium]|nr:efflux RND transporter permease subunit [Bacillota bacterium]